VRTGRRPFSMPALSSGSDYGRLNAAYEREFPLNSRVFSSYLSRFQGDQPTTNVSRHLYLEQPLLDLMPGPFALLSACAPPVDALS
jgi:hypothetical protein